jgi:hypothetical protein
MNTLNPQVSNLISLFLLGLIILFASLIGIKLQRLFKSNTQNSLNSKKGVESSNTESLPATEAYSVLPLAPPRQRQAFIDSNYNFIGALMSIFATLFILFLPLGFDWQKWDPKLKSAFLIVDLALILWTMRYIGIMSSKNKQRKWLAQNGLCTEGKILKCLQLFRSGGSSPGCEIHYQYTIEGNNNIFRKKAIHPDPNMWTSLEEGKSAYVFYDPKDPASSILYCETYAT